VEEAETGRLRDRERAREEEAGFDVEIT